MKTRCEITLARQAIGCQPYLALRDEQPLCMPVNYVLRYKHAHCAEMLICSALALSWSVRI